ncbi:MAG: alpha/beta hydrolase, partial [Pedobacter sp.]
MRFILFLLAGFLSFPLMSTAQHTVTIWIDQLPEHHPSGSILYAAGNFSGWNPVDSTYKFKKNRKGEHYLTLNLAPGKYEYKITRGGWDKSECAAEGKPVPNRTLDITGDTAMHIEIAEWADRFPSTPVKSTASSNVKIIDEHFLIPQLKRTRRIWLYLPPGYEENTKTNYPVLYLQDGQNIFDASTAYSGEWGIDEYLDTAKQKCIVVAIDHGVEKRLNEYNPYPNKKFGKGEGDKYVDFLVKTLKPYIDKNYRTLPDASHTWVGGSSMGGLIAMYAMLKYPAVYGGGIVFSPAFWMTNERLFSDIKKKGSKVNSRIFFYGGKKESEHMVTDMLRAFEE